MIWSGKNLAINKLSEELNMKFRGKPVTFLTNLPDILIIIGKDKAQSSNAQLIQTMTCDYCLTGKQRQPFVGPQRGEPHF